MITVTCSVFIKGNISSPSFFNMEPTFSFGEPRKFDKFMELGSTDIKVLANSNGKLDESVFKLFATELASDFAADFVSDNKCIDRGTTVRVINHATVNGTNWRFQMVRAELCTRLTKQQCEYGINPIDDEIREQSALATFSKLIKGTYTNQM